MNKLGQLGILAVLAICLAGCGNKRHVKGMMIYNDGRITPGSLKIDSDGTIPLPDSPGVVILFRTDGKTPNGEAGKAGEVYQVDDNRKLVKIGTFDSGKSDDQLINENQ